MVGETEKCKISKNLFGDTSEDDDFETNHESNHQANYVFNGDNGNHEPEKEGKTKSTGITELGNEARSSRLLETENDEDLDLHLGAVIPDIFGNSEDDELADYGVQNQIDQGICSEKELSSRIVATDGEVPENTAEEHDETKLKGEEAGNLLVFEIPVHPSLAHPNHMATVDLSNLIVVDPKPFDPTAYVEKEFYAVDDFGFETHIPLSNIIRWRIVQNPDGTTSVESNTRVVTLSDGSLKLLVGDEAFDVSEHDVLKIQSHLFSEHWKDTNQAQGGISRNLMVSPSSSSSLNSRSFLPDHVDSWNKNAGPENLMEQTESEKGKSKFGHEGHEDQAGPSDGKPEATFEKVVDECSDSETETEVSDNFTK